jgi:1-acyl-sn-glycerol-3-phosphate acyltransferase
MFYKLGWYTLGQAVRVAFRVRVWGRKNMPRKGAAILASNHLSFLDHMILPLATRRQIFFISKIQHFEKPVRGFFFRRIGVIPLRRGEGDGVAFQRAVETLEKGRLFAIYPEGTRSLDGRLHKGHTGVARMAYLTGSPVVPVAMHGTHRALPKGKTWPKLVKLGVTVGEPIPFPKSPESASDRALLRKKTDEIMRAIAALSGQEYVDEYQYNPEVRSHAKPRIEHPEADGPE